MLAADSSSLIRSRRPAARLSGNGCSPTRLITTARPLNSPIRLQRTAIAGPRRNPTASDSVEETGATRRDHVSVVRPDRIPVGTRSRSVDDLVAKRDSVWRTDSRHFLVRRRDDDRLCSRNPVRDAPSGDYLGEASCSRRDKIIGPTMKQVRDLLILNLTLRVFDGLFSYRVFSLGAEEANPIVAAAISNRGVIYGLLHKKSLACALLLLIFALRHRHASTSPRR